MDPTRLTDELQGLISGIGRAFFFADYLPALLFVALHQHALLPAWGLDGVLLPGVPDVPLLSGELLTALLVPLFLALLLVGLNTTLVKYYEGLLPWQRSFLLRPWQRANERKSEQWYGDLLKWKKEHRGLLRADDEASAAQRAELEAKMQALHEQIEARQPIQSLPIRPRNARPTALGNAFAVFEEYPLDRYGIDGVALWPRLRQVSDETILNALDNRKMFLDFQLNAASLAMLFAVEAVVAGIATGAPGWWIAAGLSLIVSRLSYSASVRVARSMGGLVCTCFDLYRGKLLEQFGLSRPAKFFQEYLLWLRLSAFVRRGEVFYWPGDV